MRASELKSKLARSLTTLNNSIGEMEAERVKLALPAHSGDEQAMLRVVELRGEIDTKRADLRDLEQALADIEPALKVEQATERLRQREAVHGRYQSVCEEVMDTMGAIDAAVLQLGTALRAASEPVEQARRLAIEMATPLTGNVEQVAIQRMITAHNVNIRSVRDLVETALEDVHILSREMPPYPSRPNLKLTEEMRRSLAAVDLRVREALAADRRIATAAGVVPEPVIA